MAKCTRCKLDTDTIEGGCNDNLCPQICLMQTTEVHWSNDLAAFFSGHSTPMTINSGTPFDQSETHSTPAHP